MDWLSISYTSLWLCCGGPSQLVVGSTQKLRKKKIKDCKFVKKKETFEINFQSFGAWAVEEENEFDNAYPFWLKLD